MIFSLSPPHALTLILTALQISNMTSQNIWNPPPHSSTILFSFMDLLVTGDISLASDMRILSHVFVMWPHYVWGSRIQTNLFDDTNLGFQHDMPVASLRFPCGYICGAFSWLLIDGRGPTPLWAVPPKASGPMLHNRGRWTRSLGARQLLAFLYAFYFISRLGFFL